MTARKRQPSQPDTCPRCGGPMPHYRSVYDVWRDDGDNLRCTSESVCFDCHAAWIAWHQRREERDDVQRTG